MQKEKLLMNKLETETCDLKIEMTDHQYRVASQNNIYTFSIPCQMMQRGLNAYKNLK